MRYRLTISFIGFISLLAFGIFTEVNAQISNNQTVKEIKINKNEFDSLKLQLKKLELAVDSEIKATVNRMDLVINLTDKALDKTFLIFSILGAIGSLLGGIFVWSSLMREKRSQTDYKREREFYEGQTVAREDRELNRHYMDIILSKQQIDLNKLISSKSDDLLQNQIANIAKLGEVIGFVNQTFRMQIEREKEQKGVVEQHKQMDLVIKKITENYKNKYNKACISIMKFSHLDRMRWTELNHSELEMTKEPRYSFRDVPDWIIEQKIEEDFSSVAQLHQLFGVSAFYSNEIDVSEELLKKALEIYNKKINEMTSKDKKFRAFCEFYLALIEKSWLKEGAEIEKNLITARDYLESALSLFIEAEKRDEYQTPITLGEIYSYIDNDRSKASEIFDKKIEELESLENSKTSWDKNKAALLRRAYLIKGNIDFMNNDFKNSLVYFEKAIERKNGNHFAILSKAFALQKLNDKKNADKFYNEGRESLESYGAMKKQEYTTRTIALVWCLLASHSINDSNKKKQCIESLNEMNSIAATIPGRKPIFFSPISKKLLRFKELIQEIKFELKEDIQIVS